MPRILIIDDNEDNRDMLGRRLRRRGFDVIMAEDAKRGIEKAKTDFPDVILMDLNLPDLDGWEATRKLKASDETRHLPIIAITAHEIAGNREKTLSAGCSDYHTKPVQLPLLLTQIEAVLGDDS